MKSYNTLRKANRHKAESLKSYIKRHGYTTNLFRIQLLKMLIAVYTVLRLAVMPVNYLYEWYLMHYLENLDSYVVKRQIDERNGH